MTVSRGGSDYRQRHVVHGLALVALAAFALVVAVRLGAFSTTASIDTITGLPQPIFTTFAGVDHPFHATRAATLLRTLQDGRIPRWIGDHQGGYPAEFYPLGGPWLDVVGWFALLGTVPIVVVHKLVIIALFLIPVAGFLWLARYDHLPSCVAVTAAAAHLAMPGGTFEGGAYSGGFRELVSWGLFTNVTAAVEVFLVLPALLLFAAKRRAWAGIAASGGAALAVSTNPRSAISLIAVGLGVAVVLFAHSSGRKRLERLLVVAVVATTAALLAAPVLVSLLRYDHLYHFVRYSGYASLFAYFSASVATSTLPVLVLAIAGAGWALSSSGRLAAKSATATAATYAAITAVLTLGGESSGPFQQLELTRLMPFQRLLLLYLAGVGLNAIAAWALGPGGASWRAPLAQTMVGAALFAWFVFNPFGGVANENQGLFAVPATDTAAMTDLRSAVERADALAPPGSSLYIVGSALSWHQQLWTPLWTDRPIRYNDWLWAWQSNHAAPGYSPLDGNAYSAATIERSFDQTFLQQEGIGALIVTGTAPVNWANASPALRPVAGGLYQVFDVIDPAAIVTLDGGKLDQISVQDERIVASGTSTGGKARVRVNWFPRWRATVNGRSVHVERTSDGYMTVDVPIGEVHITMSYGTTWWDWVARIMSAIGVLFLVALGISSARANRRPPHTHGSIGTSMIVGSSRSRASTIARSIASGLSARKPGMP